MVDEGELRERLRALRGMDRILPALGAAPPCFLVGGAVRDLLRGHEPVDLDIAVEGDAAGAAELLADALDGEITTHERFGTATVTAGGVDVVNLAQTRRERYPSPGALPEVEPAGLDEDLGRRDFTINAMGLALDADRLGQVIDAHRGRADLAAGLVRVLHPASFVDDPTRLLRAVRYAARLGFELETETARLAREAIADGAMATVSGPRIRDELIDLLSEDEAPRAVSLMAALGLDRGLHPLLGADPELVASAKLGALDTGAEPVLSALAGLVCPGSSGLGGWLESLGLESAARDAVARAAAVAPSLVDELARELRPSELHRLLAGEPPEALAVALALGAPGGPVLDFVRNLSPVRLVISGTDLIAAGVPESPLIGEALERTLERKLDGELDGREAELAAALETARGEE